MVDRQLRKVRSVVRTLEAWANNAHSQAVTSAGPTADRAAARADAFRVSANAIRAALGDE